jgi:hypothetical protein
MTSASKVPTRFHALALACLVAGHLPMLVGVGDYYTSLYSRLTGLVLCVCVEVWASVRYG